MIIYVNHKFNSIQFILIWININIIVIKMYMLICLFISCWWVGERIEIVIMKGMNWLSLKMREVWIIFEIYNGRPYNRFQKLTHIYQFFIPLIIGIKEFLKFNR